MYKQKFINYKIDNKNYRKYYNCNVCTIYLEKIGFFAISTTRHVQHWHKSINGSNLDSGTLFRATTVIKQTSTKFFYSIVKNVLPKIHSQSCSSSQHWVMAANICWLCPWVDNQFKKRKIHCCTIATPLFNVFLFFFSGPGSHRGSNQ